MANDEGGKGGSWKVRRCEDLDRSWAREGATLADGTNTYTAIAGDSYGRTATNTIQVHPPATHILACDANGNMITHGTRALAHDDENQLVTITIALKDILLLAGYWQAGSISYCKPFRETHNWIGMVNAARIRRWFRTHL